MYTLSLPTISETSLERENPVYSHRSSTEEVQLSLLLNLVCQLDRRAQFNLRTYAGPFVFDRDRIIQFLRIFLDRNRVPKELIDYFFCCIPLQWGTVHIVFSNWYISSGPLSPLCLPNEVTILIPAFLNGIWELFQVDTVDRKLTHHSFHSDRGYSHGTRNGAHCNDCARIAETIEEYLAEERHNLSDWTFTSCRTTQTASESKDTATPLLYTLTSIVSDYGYDPRDPSFDRFYHIIVQKFIHGVQRAISEIGHTRNSEKSGYEDVEKQSKKKRWQQGLRKRHLI